ncbi:MAG TPA: FHA domain-containing protein [Steroidobacteraceae bacterium]|nr:FHA domain-containing protein [Steroidobacteraceae bacterium]
MSLRPMSPPPVSSHAAPDLDDTAELPILDAAVEAASGETAQARSDTWIMPPEERAALAQMPGAAADGEHGAGAAVLAAQPHEPPGLLAGRDARLAELEQELSAARTALATAGQSAVEEAQAGRIAAEQRAAATIEQLGEAHQQLRAAHERAQQLQSRLDEQESASRARQQQQLEQHEALNARARAQAAAVMVELHAQRARAVSYFESLQNLEARRQIAQMQVTELDTAGEQRAADLERVTRELAARDTQLREREGALAQHAANVARLEQQVGTLSAALAQRETQLQEARDEAQGLQVSIARLQGEATWGAERVAELEAAAAVHQEGAAQQQQELQQLRAAHAELSTALESSRSESAQLLAAAQAQASSAGARTAELETELPQQRTRAAQLESTLAAELDRNTQLESELTTVRSEMEEWGGVLLSAQQERGGYQANIAAAELRARQFEQEAVEERTAAAALRSECDALNARVRTLEGHLSAAEDTLHRLESEARSRSERLAELEKSPAAADVRQVATYTGVHPELPEAARQATEAGAGVPPELPPDGAARLLVHSDGGREIVHVLGRKTSIGRTPDNDLQIDAKYVSRRHAVILVGPVHAVVEDLNSTNGVLVNGRRVTRHTLKDGDQIALGRSVYRFAVRKSTEQR